MKEAKGRSGLWKDLWVTVETEKLPSGESMRESEKKPWVGPTLGDVAAMVFVSTGQILPSPSHPRRHGELCLP